MQIPLACAQGQPSSPNLDRKLYSLLGMSTRAHPDGGSGLADEEQDSLLQIAQEIDDAENVKSGSEEEGDDEEEENEEEEGVSVLLDKSWPTIIDFVLWNPSMDLVAVVSQSHTISVQRLKIAYSFNFICDVSF